MIQRFVFAAAAACLLPAAAFAGPKVAVDPHEIVLGRIEEGNEFERFVEVKNVGDAVLIVEDVETTCGCTAATVDGQTELQPGQTQRVRVTFNSRNMEGAVTKRVTVVTNDPDARRTEINLKADVHRAVRWDPKYLSFEELGVKDPWEAKVTLEADKNLDMRVLGAFVQDGSKIGKPSHLIDVHVSDRRETAERHAYEFALTMRAERKPQRISETLVITTNIADKDTLRIPIRGDVRGRIAVQPSYAVLAIVDPGREAVRDVILSASQGSFRILSAEVENSPVQASIVPGEGGSQIVRLTYVGEAAGSNGVRQLRIETDDPEQRVIEVPVRYQTRGPAVEQTSAKGKLVSALRQASAMIIAGAALGLSTNAVRERPLPFSGSLDPPPAREPGSDLAAVPLDEAVRLWEQGAFCIDVRPAAEQQGLRVSGSFPVPADEFEDRYFGSVTDLGTEVPLLVYGAGPDSHAVRRVVSQLRDLGHADVAFVTGGIEALVAAGVSAE